MNDVDAGAVAPNTGRRYFVSYAYRHETLRVGDIVRMVEAKDARMYLLRDDFSLHRLEDDRGQYVHLREIT